MMVLFLAGCFQETLTIVDSWPAEGVTNVFADSDRGGFAYSGFPNAEQFDVAVTTWGEGFSRHEAKVHRKSNHWGVVVDGTLFDLWGRSPDHDAGVDFAVRGPTRMDVEVVLIDGNVALANVDGFSYVTANGVFADGLSGDVDLYASRNGIDLELDPGPTSSVLLQSFGDVRLDLPWGLDYDLEVYADPMWGVTVSDLGFDEMYVAPDYVRARRGDGKIRVEVWVADGKFVLNELFERN
jgi:hypothetical protein